MRLPAWIFRSVPLVTALTWVGLSIAAGFITMLVLVHTLHGAEPDKTLSADDRLALTQTRLDLESLEKQLAQLRTKFLLDERQIMSAIDTARQVEEKVTKGVRTKYSAEGYELIEKSGKWGLVKRPAEVAKKEEGKK